MKTLVTFLLILLSASFFYGCSEDAVTPNTYTIKDVFPMKVGNTWTYVIHDSIEFGVPSNHTYTVSVDSSTTFQGQPAFAGSINVDSAFRVDATLYYSGPNLNSIDPTNNSTQLVVRYPMSINESVVTFDTLYDDGHRQKEYMRYSSDNTSITVPAGTFGCIVYDTFGLYGTEGSVLDTTSRGKQYYSFGVGLVKDIDSSRSYIDSTWYQSGTTELVSYSK